MYKNVYAVSDYAASFVNRYSQASILHQGIEDIVGSNYKPINLQQKKLRVGVVGTFGERKNQLLMLEALNRLPENYQGKVEIVFVGHKTGGYFKKIKELSRPAWTIDFVGQISDPALKWPLFESIDLFFVPSIDERVSLVVLEARMLARPVAVSERVGAKYLVDDKKNGFIFKSGDAEAVNKIIIWAIENRSSLREMGLIGRKTFSAKGSLSSFQNEFIMAVDSIVS